LTEIDPIVKAALSAVEREARRLAKAADERDRLILAAYAAGAGPTAIGRAAGISKARVHQIINAARG